MSLKTAALACLGFLVLHSMPCDAAERTLKAQATVVEPIESQAEVSLKVGKVIANYIAPNHRTALLERDEGEVGDFVWHTIYLKADGKYLRLGTCQVIKKVAWSKDSKVVSFELIKATGPETSTTFAARYRVGEREIALKALTETDVQSSM